MRTIFAIAFLCSLLCGIGYGGEFPVKPMFYPAVTRDDSTSIVFRDRPSQLGVYFFRAGAEVPDLRKFRFFVELPAAVRLKSAVPIAGWRAAARVSEFASTPGKTPGSIRYELPLPQAELPTRLDLKQDVAFTGFHTLFLIEPAGGASVPEAFPVFWEMEGAGGERLSGELPFRSQPFVRAAKLPRTFEVWADPGAMHLDGGELAERLELFRGMGVTHLDTDENPNFIPDYFRKLRDGGFQLYCGNIQKFIFRFDRPVIAAPNTPEQCQVNIRGENVFGSDHYRNTPWCPAQFYQPESPLFQAMLTYVAKLHREGVGNFYSDHELDIFDFCYCERCRRDFAEFSGVPFDSVKALEPAVLAGRAPELWYRFRCRQTGRMVEALRHALSGAKNLRIGMNSMLVYIDYAHGKLGQGRSLFADDPRLTDSMVDFHNIDTLSGLNMDAVILDEIVGHVRKPVIARTHSNYCYGWLFAHCAARYEKAKQAGRKVGTDFRPQLQYLSILNMAATGVDGVELMIDRGSYDAAVANAVARAMEVVAEYETIWRNGERCEKSFKVYPLDQKESRFLQDDSTIAGRIWAGFFFRIYGPLMYRAQRLGEERMISFFNWDMAQSQKIGMLIPGDNRPKTYIFDKTGKRLLSPDGKKSEWSSEELARGVCFDVPSLGCALLTISGNPPENRNEFTIVSASGKLPEWTPPYDLHHYRKSGISPQSLQNKLDSVLKQK